MGFIGTREGTRWIPCPHIDDPENAWIDDLNFEITLDSDLSSIKKVIIP